MITHQDSSTELTGENDGKRYLRMRYRIPAPTSVMCVSVATTILPGCPNAYSPISPYVFASGHNDKE